MITKEQTTCMIISKAGYDRIIGNIILIFHSKKQKKKLFDKFKKILFLKQLYHYFKGNFLYLQERDKLNYFRKFKFMQDIPNSKLMSTLMNIKYLELKRNSFIYHEGNIADNIYFIKSGEV